MSAKCGDNMTKPKAICVFCGSNSGTDSAYAKAAADFGRILARQQIRLVYGGGGTGLMGEVAKATHLAGGKITGIVPEAIAQIERQYENSDRKIVTKDMHERKAHMFQLADAFVVLPGGIGTLEEVVEVLWWAYLDFHAKPILLANINNYWQPFFDLIEHTIDQGFARPELLNGPSAHDALLVADSVEDIVPTIEAALKYRSAKPQHEDASVLI